MKKRVFALTLSFILIMSLFAACGGGSSAPETTPAPTPESTPVETPAAPPTPTPEPPVHTPGVSPTRGVWDGNVFTSTYLGLQLTLPEGWIVATDEEISEATGLGVALMEQGTVLADIWDMIESTTITDMMAHCQRTGSHISIAFERFASPDDEMSMADYMDMAAEHILSLGMEVNFDFPGTTKIGAYDWYSYGSSLELLNVGINGRYFVSIEDGFARVITIVYASIIHSAGQLMFEETHTAEEILEWFSSL